MGLNARPLWTLMHCALALLIGALAIPIGHAKGCVNSPPGLRRWWAADGSAVDVIGSHDAGRRLGAGYGTGVSDAAFALDGVGDYCAVGLLGDFALTEAFAFSISASIDPVELTRLDSPQIIASNDQRERGDFDHFSTDRSIVGSQLKFGLEDQRLARVSASTTMASGWQHVAGTCDGTTLRLYVNGVLRASATRSFSGSRPNSRGWNIGDASPGTNASWQNLGGSPRNAAFNERIDELQLYDRALTADEVAALHALGRGALLATTAHSRCRCQCARPGLCRHHGRSARAARSRRVERRRAHTMIAPAQSARSPGRYFASRSSQEGLTSVRFGRFGFFE